MNIEISPKQYKLIREALERYRYICENDPEYRHILEDLDTLESSLIKQSFSTKNYLK